MNVLEKILEEIEEKIKLAGRMMVEKPCDKLDEIANDTAEAFIGAYEECSEIIRSHMDETPNNEWIPTSERLPEDGRRVLVWYEYFRYGDYNCMYQTHGIGFQYKGHWSGDVSGTNARCIAWQPLPEPYKPQEG